MSHNITTTERWGGWDVQYQAAVDVFEAGMMGIWVGVWVIWTGVTLTVFTWIWVSRFWSYPGSDVYLHMKKPGDLYLCKHDKYQHPCFQLQHLNCAGACSVYLQQKLSISKLSFNQLNHWSRSSSTRREATVLYKLGSFGRGVTLGWKPVWCSQEAQE